MNINKPTAEINHFLNIVHQNSEGKADQTRLIVATMRIASYAGMVIAAASACFLAGAALGAGAPLAAAVLFVGGASISLLFHEIYQVTKCYESYCLGTLKGTAANLANTFFPQQTSTYVVRDLTKDTLLLRHLV